MGAIDERENRCYFTEQRRREEIQAAVYKISQAAVSSDSLQELFQEIHAILGELMPVENFFIALFDPTSNRVSYPYFVDQIDEFPQSEQLGKGLTAYVIRTGQSLLASPEVFHDLVARGEVESVGTPSIDWLGVPLAIKEQIIGILAVQSYTEGVRFSEEEKSILQFVSNQIALVIERKRAEETIRVSEARYRGIVEDQSELICRWIKDGRLTFVNEAYARYRGKPREALIGTNFYDPIDPADREQSRDCQSLSRNAENLIPYEVRVQSANGEIRWVQWTDRAIYNEQGCFIEFQSVGQEITDRKQREHELEAIVSVSSALRKAATRAEMLPVILDQLVNLLRLDVVVLAMLDPNLEEIVFELGRGNWSSMQGFCIPLGEGISGQVMDTLQPYIIQDVASEERLFTRDWIGSLQSAACAPLIADRQAIGVVWIGKTSAINEHDIHLLKAVSDIAANAIFRATLFEQTQLRFQRLEALRAIDLAISASLDVAVTMTILLDQVTLQLGVHAADVLLFNPLTQMLEYAAGRGFTTGTIQNTRLRLGQGFAGQAALDRQIVFIPNLEKDHDAQIRAQFLIGEQFVCFTAIPLVSKGQIKGVLELFYRTPMSPDPEWLDFFQSLGANAAIAIDNAEMFDTLQRTNLDLTLAYDATIDGWSRALELRDQETEGHTRRVADLTVRLAQSIGIPNSDLLHVRRGALLHDIGKMSICDTILKKEGPLTEAEWTIMRMHPVYAHQMLAPVQYLRPALDIPYYHHERWDGSGYPHGIQKDQIPLVARIFAVADVWDALTHDRRYRPAWTRAEALDYLKVKAGVLFDPQVVDAFIQMNLMTLPGED